MIKLKLSYQMVCCHTDYDKVKAVLSDGVLILRQVVTLTDGVLILRQVVTLTMIKLKLSYQMVC